MNNEKTEEEESVVAFIFRQKNKRNKFFNSSYFQTFIANSHALLYVKKFIFTAKNKRVKERKPKLHTPPPSDFTPKEDKAKSEARSKKARARNRNNESKSPTFPHSDFAQRAKSEEQASEKIPSSVSRRKAEKRSTAKRSAGCLSEASSCASAERSLAAALKLQTAVFLFVTFFFLAAKRKSKNEPKENVKGKVNKPKTYIEQWKN